MVTFLKRVPSNADILDQDIPKHNTFQQSMVLPDDAICYKHKYLVKTYWCDEIQRLIIKLFTKGHTYVFTSDKKEHDFHYALGTVGNSDYVAFSEKRQCLSLANLSSNQITSIYIGCDVFDDFVINKDDINDDVDVKAAIKSENDDASRQNVEVSFNDKLQPTKFRMISENNYEENSENDDD